MIFLLKCQYKYFFFPLSLLRSLVFTRHGGRDRMQSRRRKPDAVPPASLGRRCQKGNILKGPEQRINVGNKF